jgi:hypothetical protein
LFGIISSFLLCNFLWHLLTHQSVSFTFVGILSSLWYSSLLTLWNFLVHVFFLPYNCFATSLQTPRCVSSTSIVVLLNVFGLSSFLVDKNYYTFKFFHMQQNYFLKMGNMPIWIDMMAYV